MTMPRTAATIAPETLHPSLWLASQLAHSTTRCIDTGYAALSAQLPGGGWPTGTLIDLLQQQPGIGELRLLHPALASLGSRPIVLLSQLVWVRSGAKSGDALWAAEQILRSGCCGALLFWQQHARGDTLRRLHLAAQSGDTLFCMLRPLTSAQDSSPAPLRLSLRPAAGGIDIGFIKRKGPQRDTPLFLPLDTHARQPTAPLDRPLPAALAARSLQPQLVD